MAADMRYGRCVKGRAARWRDAVALPEGLPRLTDLQRAARRSRLWMAKRSIDCRCNGRGLRSTATRRGASVSCLVDRSTAAFGLES